MTRNTARIIGATMLVMAVLAVCTLPLAAADLKPIVNTATASGVTPRLDELSRLPQPAQYGLHETPPLRLITKPNYGHAVDTVEQRGVFLPPTIQSLLTSLESATASRDTPFLTLRPIPTWQLATLKCCSG